MRNLSAPTLQALEIEETIERTITVVIKYRTTTSIFIYHSKYLGHADDTFEIGFIIQRDKYV